LIPKIPKSGDFFVYLEKIWTSNKYGKVYFYTLIFLFDIFPKLILCITFIIEILVLQEIKYFFYLISIILIPISFAVFLKILLNFTQRNLPIMKSYFREIKGYDPIINDKGITIGFKRYEYLMKPEYKNVINDKEFILVLLQVDRLQDYVMQIKADITKVTPYVTLITSTIYIIGGIFRLIFLW
jgi:hypothetical protein